LLLEGWGGVSQCNIIYVCYLISRLNKFSFKISYWWRHNSPCLNHNPKLYLIYVFQLQQFNWFHYQGEIFQACLTAASAKNLNTIPPNPRSKSWKVSWNEILLTEILFAEQKRHRQKIWRIFHFLVKGLFQAPKKYLWKMHHQGQKPKESGFNFNLLMKNSSRRTKLTVMYFIIVQLW
jgi:hypothetical protein